MMPERASAVDTDVSADTEPQRVGELLADAIAEIAVEANSTALLFLAKHYEVRP